MFVVNELSYLMNGNNATVYMYVYTKRKSSEKHV